MAKTQRRSKRLPLQVPVLVYGRDMDNVPFHEPARMLSLNQNGGLLALSARVSEGHKILVVNRTTVEERECRIVSIQVGQGGKRHVGIEFIQPAPDFWRISFNPQNSRTAAGKACG
jgi:hypothetical protein